MLGIPTVDGFALGCIILRLDFGRIPRPGDPIAEFSGLVELLAEPQQSVEQKQRCTRNRPTEHCARDRHRGLNLGHDSDLRIVIARDHSDAAGNRHGRRSPRNVSVLRIDIAVSELESAIHLVESEALVEDIAEIEA